MQALRMTMATPYKPLPKPAFGLGDLTDFVRDQIKQQELDEADRKNNVGLKATDSYGQLLNAENELDWAARCAAVGLTAAASIAQVLARENK